MRQKIYCVVENDFQNGLKQKLTGWNFDPLFIDPSVADNVPKKSGLLPKEESWLEDWANEVCLKLPPSDENPILLVQAELRENLKAAQGIFLAELVWKKRTLPTLIAAINLRAGRQLFSRRARIGGESFLPIISAKESDTAVKPSFFLWDIQGDEGDLKAAINQAAKLFPIDADYLDLQREIINAIAAEQSASYRHRLGGLQASLRIMEGAYRWGWIDETDVKDFITILENRIIEDGDNLRLQNLELFAECVQRFEITRMKLPEAEKSFLEIIICDDDLENSGWEILVTRLVEKKLGLRVKGFKSRDALEKYLNEKQEVSEEKQQDNRVIAVLLDVDYRLPDTNLTESVDERYLRFLHEKYPLLDVILFTAKLNDGTLVREANRLGYGFFFKELDQPIRKPKKDAEEFLKIIDNSVSSFLVRALQNLASEGVVDNEAGDEINNLLSALKAWKQTPHPALTLQLPPLLERQFRNCCAIAAAKNWGAKDVDWSFLTNAQRQIRSNPSIATRLSGSLLPLQSWARIWKLAKFTRHTIVHGADLVLDKSILPAVGVSASLIVGITLLHQIILTEQQDTKKNINALDLIYKAVLRSNRFVKPAAFTFFQNAFEKDLMSADYRKIFDNCAIKIDENKQLFGSLTANRNNLAKCLLEETYFFDDDLEINGVMTDCSDSLNLYRMLHIILVSCLLDHQNSNL